jgi:ribosomal protein S27E
MNGFWRPSYRENFMNKHEVRCQKCHAILGIRTDRGFVPSGSAICIVRATRVDCLKCLREQRVYAGPLVSK